MLTPERFLAEYYPRLPLPVFAPEDGRGTHMAAFRDACGRHGLELRQIDERRHEIVRGGEVIGRMDGLRTDLVTRKAAALCRDKALTVPHLARAGVPVPEQRVFDWDELDRGLDFARRRGFEVVVKPAIGAGGRGITTAIAGEDDFRRAWSHAFEHRGAHRRSRPLVESRCAGIDVRAVVVMGRFVCAATRVAASVIGDGASALNALIARKNAARAANPAHSRYPIVVDERLVRRLAAHGMSLDTVLPAGRPMILSEVSNVHAGGDSCEITGIVPPCIRDVAERAARAVPGLGVVGVDLMASALDDRAQVFVLEMNTSANFGIHHAPFRGEPRNPADDVVRAMIDAPPRRRAE